MDKISKKDFFSAIVSSNILAPYLERDAGLAELLKHPDHPSIHYFENPAPANQLLPVLKRRLEFLNLKNIDHNREATKLLVAFMEEHPESQIYDVTFNCPTQHYGVRSGWVDHQLQVICVMTGGHIPGEVLGEALI